jgi:hypothetical protein
MLDMNIEQYGWCCSSSTYLFISLAFHEETKGKEQQLNGNKRPFISLLGSTGEIKHIGLTAWFGTLLG